MNLKREKLFFNKNWEKNNAFNKANVAPDSATSARSLALKSVKFKTLLEQRQKQMDAITQSSKASIALR